MDNHKQFVKSRKQKALWLGVSIAVPVILTAVVTVGAYFLAVTLLPMVPDTELGPTPVSLPVVYGLVAILFVLALWGGVVVDVVRTVREARHISVIEDSHCQECGANIDGDDEVLFGELTDQGNLRCFDCSRTGDDQRHKDNQQ